MRPTFLRGTFKKAYQKKCIKIWSVPCQHIHYNAVGLSATEVKDKKAALQIRALSLSSGSNLMQLNSRKQFSKQIRLLTKLCDYTTRNSRNTHCIVANKTPFLRQPPSPRQHSQYKMCLHSLNTFWHYTRDYTTGETGMTSASSPHFHPFPAQNT